MTQEHFYSYLRYDLEHANRRVVIYSPFITENRIGELNTSFLSCARPWSPGLCGHQDTG